MAESIIDREVKELALTAQTVARKMNWLEGDARPLVLVGSLWKQASFSGKFQDELSRLNVPYRAIYPSQSPAQGMAMLASRQYRRLE